jgi:hypothetical protein
MNVQLPLRMDKTAFLGWVQGRKEHYELDRGRVVMMTGGSRAHWQITFNLAKALDARLDPNKWAVLPEFGVDVLEGNDAVVRIEALGIDVPLAEIYARVRMD